MCLREDHIRIEKSPLLSSLTRPHPLTDECAPRRLPRHVLLGLYAPHRLWWGGGWRLAGKHLPRRAGRRRDQQQAPRPGPRPHFSAPSRLPFSIFHPFPSLIHPRPPPLILPLSFLFSTPQTFSFSFDRVLKGAGDKLYPSCTEAIVSGAVTGQAGAVFVYGHGGSGKTSTLLGSASGGGGGLLQKACAAMLASSGGRLWVSVVEVYKEVPRDLLKHSSAPLRLRDAGPTTVMGSPRNTAHVIEDTTATHRQHSFRGG